MYNKWRSRKYRLVWGVILIATTLCYLDKVDGQTWALVVGTTVGWYEKVNVDQKKALGGQ